MLRIPAKKLIRPNCIVCLRNVIFLAHQLFHNTFPRQWLWFVRVRSRSVNERHFIRIVWCRSSGEVGDEVCAVLDYDLFGTGRPSSKSCRSAQLVRSVRDGSMTSRHLLK